MDRIAIPKRPIAILVLIAAAVAVAILAGCAPPSRSVPERLLSECRAWDGWVARSAGTADARRYAEAADNCWSQVADTAARRQAWGRYEPAAAPAAEWRIPIYEPAPSPEPRDHHLRPMPIPGAGAQTPPRGPFTWGETPFDVPPIMRDVPVEAFPWLAH